LPGCLCRDFPVIPSEVEESRGATQDVLMRHQNYFVYILTNGDRHTVLYIGITNSLERRASEHSLGLGSAFARQYNAHKLIYFEAYSDPTSAIAREKQLKRWSRAKKEALIDRRNPEWRDLFSEMYALRPIRASR
jgi:putative endonuclease